MASEIPQATIDKITKTRGVLASVKVYIETSNTRTQEAIEQALALGATAEQLAPVQEAADAMSAEADVIAAAITANP